MRRRAGLAAALAACVLVRPAAAREVWTAGESSLRLTTAVEGMGVAAAAPRGTGGTGGSAALGFGRIRLGASLRTGPAVGWEVAWDNRVAVDAGPSGSPAAAFALPSGAPAPFRAIRAGGVVARSGRTLDYDEIDRASVSWHASRFEVVAGRQAVGWGRGQLFGAVDIFAPFTPLEIDREWRRGVDAVSADLKVTSRSSVGIVAAAGRNRDSSAVGGRIRGDLGFADAELVAAKRAEDEMYGWSASAAVGGPEVHAEAAVFHTPGDLPVRGVDGRSDWIPKAVVGASNNFALGSGLLASVEYHWSGFGAARPSELAALEDLPAFTRRLQRGDTQIAGRQAAAVTARYTFGVAWSAGLQVLGSLIDSSAVGAATVTWDLSDRVTATVAGYLSTGAGVSGDGPRSQFGGVPPSILLQVRFYD